MRFGLLLPQGYFDEFDGWAPPAAWERILEIARTAERRGFDSVWLGEHVLAKWNQREIVFDCVTLAASIAAAVPRVEIGFTVVNSTFRNPAMTAKAAGTIDAVSGGRLDPRARCRLQGARGAGVRTAVPRAGRTPGHPRGAFRDHQPADPPGRATVRLPRQARLGRAGGQWAGHERPRPHPAAHRRTRQAEDIPHRGALLRRAEHQPDPGRDPRPISRLSTSAAPRSTAIRRRSGSSGAPTRASSTRGCARPAASG